MVKSVQIIRLLAIIRTLRYVCPRPGMAVRKPQGRMLCTVDWSLENICPCHRIPEEACNTKEEEMYAGKGCRHFLAAVHWILRTGAQRRELPADLGKRNTVFKRNACWQENGVWADMLEQFAQDPDMAAVMPDSACISAHTCAAGRSRKGAVSICPGRSRGGFSSKIHLLVNALGFPLTFILTGGERLDMSKAESLLAPFHFDAVIADRGYDSDPLQDLLATQ